MPKPSPKYAFGEGFDIIYQYIIKFRLYTNAADKKDC